MHSQNREGLELSIIVPLFNEFESIPHFLARMREVAPELGIFELIMVDDGSRDGSRDVIARSQGTLPVQVIILTRNFGQTAALAAGIERARGDVIVTIDADLENDPHDIPKLVALLNEGYDVVSGWRQGRWSGQRLTRKFPSLIANWLISRLTGVYLHDYGCTLKAYRADVIKSVRLYGEMHRFIPAYASWQGGKVAELKVKHEPRRHGKSNYGFGRVFRVLLDLVVVVFMHRYMNRPMHFFGAWGFLSAALGVIAGFVAVLLRLLGVADLVETPLPILATLFTLVGVQLILFGVIAEILMRTYYESQNKRPYNIKKS